MAGSNAAEVAFLSIDLCASAGLRGFSMASAGRLRLASPMVPVASRAQVGGDLHL